MFLIPIIIFIIAFVCVIFNIFRQKSDASYDEKNYIKYEKTIKNNTDSQRHTYRTSSITNPKSLGYAIYGLVFSIIWNIVLIFIMVVALQTNIGVAFLMFIPFILIGIFVLFSSIKGILSLASKNNDAKNNNYSDNDTIIDDDYFVKYCSSCGESLNKTDHFCQNCGKEISK